MKTFLKKLSIFILLFITLCISLDYLSMTDAWRLGFARLTDSQEFISLNVGTDEIVPYINKVQTPNNTTTLIIGDSVCCQLFEGLQQYNEDICIAGSNAAIAMTGQYILAAEYIKNHPNATDIYLFVLPTSLCSTFDTHWGYQYTVMPFIQTGTLHLLEENTIAAMEATYGKLFLKPQIVDMIDRSAVNRKIYLNMIENYRTGYEPKTTFEIADQYIRKIYDLCEANNITLHLYACPVSDSRYDAAQELAADYNGTWLQTQFPDYFANLTTFPDEQTKDGIHFAGEYETQENFNEQIRTILAGTELLQVLYFE